MLRGFPYRLLESHRFVGWAGPPARAVMVIGLAIVPHDLAANYHRVGKGLAHPTVFH